MCVLCCSDADVWGVQERQGDAAVGSWLRQRRFVPRSGLFTVRLQGSGRSRDPAGARSHHQPPAADLRRHGRRRDVHVQGGHRHVVRHRRYPANVATEQVNVSVCVTQDVTLWQ